MHKMNRKDLLARRNRLVLPFFIIVMIAAAPASAEPYLAVYKGMQCSSCHSHPAGGGLRNVYGNAFAQTELPTERVGDATAGLWTGEVFERLSVGADLRAGFESIDVPNRETTSEFEVSRGTVYVEARIIPNRLSLYLDQQVAPGGSLNREAYVRLNTSDRRFHFMAGQFFLPFGLRLQDDTAFVRQFTGINFTNSDRGIQAGFESGPWSTQVSVTNGTGGSNEVDSQKQISVVANYVRALWRVGASLNSNNADTGDRQMQNVFFGLQTGPIGWLVEADLISDDIAGGGERDGVAGLVEANWRPFGGHNVKVSYDYFDPDNDISEDHQVRYSLVWEYTPMQFLQGRFGARIYDGIPQQDFQNRDEFFAELHGFF